MQPGPSLQRAIDRCYEVFAAYPRPRVLETSPYRDADEILRTLTSAPLRELTEEQIGPYSGWALTTVGDVDDYRHFLPRILEQAVRENTRMGTEPAVLAGKLKLGQWLSWPKPEQDAIRDIFVEAWTQAVHEPGSWEVEPWFCGIAALGIDTPKVLDAWSTADARAPRQHLAEFLWVEAKLVFASDPEERIFWSHVDEVTIISIRDWLGSQEVLSSLVAAREGATSDDLWALDRALEALVAFTAPRLH